MRVYHYHSIDGLSSCLVITAQLLAGKGCWTGRVIYNRFESPSGSELVCRTKEFGEHPTEVELVQDIEDWIRHSLFERWTAAEMPEQPRTIAETGETLTIGF